MVSSSNTSLGMGDLRGHGAKIAEAVRLLRADDRLPPYLRPVERNRRIIEWLIENGYAPDLPSRHAIDRYCKFHLQTEQNAQLAQ